METPEIKNTELKLGRFLIPILSCLILPMALMALAEMEALSPQGTGYLDFFVILALAGCCCTVVPLVFIIGFWRFCSDRDRQNSLVLMACAVSIFIGAMAGGSLSQHLRMEALLKLAERSKPLITAIKLYEQKTGTPPSTLDALVPEYIPNIPAVGIGVSSEYHYQLFTNSPTYGDNKWVLQVFGAGQSLSFDTFIYLPMQDYSILHGSQMRRIGDWAYVHQG